MIINSLIETFFSLLDFDFKQDLKSDCSLLKKTEFYFLQNQIFYYENKNQTDTFFYLITTTLSDDQLVQIHKYIWNENKAITFFYPTEDANLHLCYAKSNPKEELTELDYFDITKPEAEKFEKIKKWQFDSSAFWLNYPEFLDKVKNKNKIDKELVSALDA
jgi:hypothetical protein